MSRRCQVVNVTRLLRLMVASVQPDRPRRRGKGPGARDVARCERLGAFSLAVASRLL